MTLGRTLIDRARVADILAIAQRYGATLRKAGGSEYVGPCPRCGSSGPRSNRFSINTSKQVWHCRRCKPANIAGDVIGLVQHLAGVGFTEAIAILTGEPLPQRREPVKVTHASHSRQTGTGFLRWWHNAEPIIGTPAEKYLTKTRGIDIEQIPNIDDVVRFHRHCVFGEGIYRPCQIALIRDIKTDAPIGIIRTPLDADGHKAPVLENGELIDRKTLGAKQGGAVKLWSDEAVTRGLVVGEGLESTAAAATEVEHKGALLQPAWALVDSGNLKFFPVLPEIEHLTILVDHDHPDKYGRCAGQDAADACTATWTKASRYVTQLTPTEMGWDFNDIALDDGAL